MRQLRGFKFRFYPTSAQRLKLAQTFGCTRFVYNWALALRTNSYYQDNVSLSYTILQRRLAKKKKGSNNRYKTRLKVAKLHAKIADCRLDFLHKLSSKLVRESQSIYTETLAVKNMMANHKLARAIADCAWGEFLRQLEYKCQWHDRKLGAIKVSIDTNRSILRTVILKTTSFKLNAVYLRLVIPLNLRLSSKQIIKIKAIPKGSKKRIAR